MKIADHKHIHGLPGLLPNADQVKLLTLLLKRSDAPVTSRFSTIDDRDKWLENLIESGKTDPRVRDLLPLAYHCLTERGIEPKSIAYLRSLRIAFAGRNHQQGNAWREVVVKLQSAGIEPVLLKGNSLAIDYYEDPALRPMTDADILVRVDDQSTADCVLQALSWRKVIMGHDTANAVFEHATPYTRPGKEWSDIDLHVHVLSKCHRSAIDNWFFKQLEPFDFYGIQAQRLNPTALLTHLLLHGLRHSRTTPIRWIVDCDRVLRHRSSEINWQELLAFTRQHQFTWRIALALLYLHDEFGTSLPPAVVEQLRQHHPNSFERMETTFLLKPFSANDSLPQRTLHLATLMVWRASRMRGGWYFPLDLYRVIRHKIGGRSLRTAFIRAWQYGKSR